MEELKIDYNFDLHDFKMMENIEHSYFPNENISPAEEVLKWYEKNDLTCAFRDAFRDTSQKQLMFLFFKELPVFSKCPQKQVSSKAKD